MHGWFHIINIVCVWIGNKHYHHRGQEAGALCYSTMSEKSYGWGSREEPTDLEFVDVGVHSYGHGRIIPVIRARWAIRLFSLLADSI